MRATFVICMASALALSACSGGEDDNLAADTTATEAALPSEASAEAAAAPDTGTPQGFVDMAASSDMYEVEAGKLAGEMGKSDEVKSFGAMMVKDHTVSTDKLKAAVAEAGDGVTVPAAMQPKHQQQLDALRAAGDGFDALYAQQQVAAHEEALALMQAQAASGTSAPLKAHAAATAPVIEAHLGHARDLP